MGPLPGQVRVVVAVGHGLYPPWIDIARLGQLETWAKKPGGPGFGIVHIHGSPVGSQALQISALHERMRLHRFGADALAFLEGASLVPWRNWIPQASESQFLGTEHSAVAVRVPDVPLTVRWKILGALQYLMEQCDFTHLFLTTSSSYVHLPRLIRTVEEMPRSGVCAGKPVAVQVSSRWGARETLEFPSGACRLFSRDVVAEIIANRAKWPTGRLDDVGLGFLLQRMGYRVRALETVNIVSMDEINACRLDDPTVFHFRLKSGTLQSRNDVQLMRALHERLEDLPHELR